MTISKAAATELVRDRLYPAWYAEQAGLKEIDCWYRWHDTEDRAIIPPHASTERRALAELAKTPFLGLVVTNVAQALYVDGYRSPEDDEDQDATPYQLWLENGLAKRQGAIWRAALAYGYSYGTALPGRRPLTGERTAVLRGVSPRKGLAFYGDEVEDDWPLYFLRVEQNTMTSWRVKLYDDTEVHTFDMDGQLTWLESQVHGVGVCPVVRYTNMLDLDGRTDGEVAPFIPMAKRIKKTVYDRLLVQHYSSWKVLWATGLTKPEPLPGETAEEAAERMRIVLRQGSILLSDSPETQFGALPETPLDGLIRSTEHDVKMLAAVSQTPVHAMVGDLINLSADALAAARSTLDAKVSERKESFGDTAQQHLRLGAQIAGDAEAAADLKAHVVWRDTSIRSLASAADALGKFAQMLGVPPQGLWDMIPGVSKARVEEWRNLLTEDDEVSQALRALAADAATPPAPETSGDE